MAEQAEQERVAAAMMVPGASKGSGRRERRASGSGDHDGASWRRGPTPI